MTIDGLGYRQWLRQSPPAVQRTPAEVEADRARIEAKARATLDRLELQRRTPSMPMTLPA